MWFLQGNPKTTQTENNQWVIKIIWKDNNWKVGEKFIKINFNMVITELFKL